MSDEYTTSIVPPPDTWSRESALGWLEDDCVRWLVVATCLLDQAEGKGKSFAIDVLLDLWSLIPAAASAAQGEEPTVHDHRCSRDAREYIEAAVAVTELGGGVWAEDIQLIADAAVSSIAKFESLGSGHAYRTDDH